MIHCEMHDIVMELGDVCGIVVNFVSMVKLGNISSFDLDFAL